MVDLVGIDVYISKIFNVNSDFSALYSFNRLLY